MKSTRLLRLIADAIAFTVLYVVGLWLVVSQGWLSQGTHLLQAQFAALGFRHFENVSNTMDNLLAFVDKVRNWNDGLNRDGVTHFWIDQALPTETLGEDKKVDTFLFMHRELMLYFSKLEVLPRKKNRNVINKAAEEFQEARGEFLKVRSAS